MCHGSFRENLVGGRIKKPLLFLTNLIYYYYKMGDLLIQNFFSYLKGE